jgi:hypothetical protein
VRGACAQPEVCATRFLPLRSVRHQLESQASQYLPLPPQNVEKTALQVDVKDEHRLRIKRDTGAHSGDSDTRLFDAHTDHLLVEDTEQMNKIVKVRLLENVHRIDRLASFRDLFQKPEWKFDQLNQPPVKWWILS